MWKMCRIVGVYTWLPALHAGNPPDIPPVPCIGNVKNMPLILYRILWHRKVYRKFYPILHQDMLWKFSTILHKDWCRINDLSCTSIGIGTGIINILHQERHVIEILNNAVQVPSMCRKFDLSFACPL